MYIVHNIPVSDSGDNMISAKIAISNLILGVRTQDSVITVMHSDGRPDDLHSKKNMCGSPLRSGRVVTHDVALYHCFVVKVFMTSKRIIG